MFACECFLCAGNLFVKKNKNKLEIVLITSFHYTTKLTRGHSKSTFFEVGMDGGGGAGWRRWGGAGRVIEKRTKTNRGRGSPIMCVRSLF